MSTSYEEFLRRQEAGRTGIAAEASTTIGPDEAARRVRYKRVYGVEPPDPAVQQARAARIEAEQAVARQPRMSSWLQASLSNLALARGVMSNMADVAETLQVPRKKKGTLEAARDFLAESMGRDNPQGGNYLRDSVAPAINDLSWANTARALAAGTVDTAGAVFGSIDAGITADNTLGMFRAQRALADAAIMGLSDAITGKPQTARTLLRANIKETDRFADTIAEGIDTQTAFGNAFNQGVRSLPLAATALVGGAAAGSAKLAATLMGGLATGSSYNYGIAQGLDEQTALRYGVVDGLIEAGTEFIPFAKLLPSTSGSFARNMLEGIGADLLGEQVATFGQDLNQFLTIDQPNGKTAEAFWAERGDAAFDTAIASLVGSGSLAAASGAAQFAARKLGRKVTAASLTEAHGRFFDTLNRLAAANDVLQRDPKSFEEFVDHVAEGTDASEVFVEAAELQTVLNQSDLTVEQVFEITGMTPEGLQQAVDRGEDVSMTIGEYAARIATTPLSEQLLPHLRLAPDQMSRKQAETFLQGAAEEFQADADAALAEGVQGNERQASRQRVEEMVLGQLNTTRRFTNDVNQTYASIVGAFFDTQATKLGMNAEDLAARYGLTVQSGEVAQPTFDQPQSGDLIGLPANSRGGFAPARQAAETYMAARGLEYNPPRVYSPVDRDRARRIAAEYEAMQNNPNDPEVRAAYTALVEETLAQYEMVKATGLQIEFVQGEDPYAGNPWGAVDDVRDNNHIWVFSTEDGYGREGISDQQRAENPMLAVAEGETWGGQPVLVNDVFRVVHDYFGHIKTGVGFRAGGEENAWRAHSSMFTPLARRALTSETRGQNSWLNFGPHGEANRDALIGDTVFAEQKIGLMPEWTSEEGVADPETFNQDPIEQLYANSATLAGHNPGARYMIARNETENGLQRGQEIDARTAGSDPGATLAIATAALADGGYVEAQIELFPGLDLGQVPDPEVQGDYIDVDGEERPTTNSDGAYIAATESALRNFWRWFGDSEMVDVDGRPVVFYHGTKADFSVQSKDDFAFSTGYTQTFFFATDRGTARDFAKDAENGVIKAYLRAEKVDKYNAEGRGWAEVVPIDDYELSEARETWLQDRLADFTPSSYLEETDEGVWEVLDARSSETLKFDDEDAAQEALDEIHDEEREAREEELREALDEIYEIDLVGLGYLENAGYSTDYLAEQATHDGYDAVLIDAVDEGSGATTVAIILGNPGAIKASDNSGMFDPQDPRVFHQSAITNPLDAFRRESLYPTRAVRHADGTVYTDAPGFYPDRLAKIAEQIGAKAVVAVPANDNRLDQGVALWHSRPPLNPDGTITIQHWGPSGVTVTDPTRWGESNSLPASERSAITSGLPRTYFGIASGQPGGYIVEFPSRQQYEARVPADKLYDVAADPDGLKQGDGVAKLEQRIKAAGYLGYWSANDALGLVATVFEPVAVQPARAQTMFQDAVFFSALERTLEKTATQKASAQQWEATLKKTPGIKAEELEWTGILDFLQMQAGPITRDALLEVVRGAGIRVDEVLLGAQGMPAGEELEKEILLVQLGSDETVSREEAIAVIRQQAREGYFDRLRGQGTQFSSWTTDPQNETYRELLITLPVGEGRNPNRAPSTHWDTDGVIAHARFMDKTDADGKKVLFIEEVQSDWHQKGRDQGYANPLPEAERQAIVNEFNAALDAKNAAQRAVDDNLAALLATEGNVTDEQEAERNRLSEELSRANLRMREAAVNATNILTRTGGIPDAPFRTGWPELVMKRMIRWAAEHGYERIAWTTGTQQETRYWGELQPSQRAFQEATEPYRVGEELLKVLGPELAAVLPLEVVDAPMLGAVENDQVRQAVVQAIPVDVVDVLVREGFSPEQFSRDPDMVGNALPVVDRATVARGFADALQFVGARLRAALDGVLPAEAAGGDRELFSTIRASDLNPRVIVGLLTTRPPGSGASDASAGAAALGAEAGGLARVRPEYGSAELAVALNWHGRAVAERTGNRQAIYDAPPGGGMRAFYDRNLVNITNKLVKKYGAKVGPVKISANGAVTRALLEGRGTPEGVAKAESVGHITTQPGFDITPELADAAMGGFPLFQRDRGPRGQIAFAPDITAAPSVITLLRGADLSTFMHELGHFFFEVTNHMASQAGAPAEIVADRDAMLKYLGVESVTEWENRTPDQRREGHERVARSFEAYLFEGRAPSIELQGVFGKLRSWMLQVYRTLTRLNVELTDEVRGVFDRMLASEEQIAEAQADAEMRPMFSEQPGGMSQADWEEYQRLNTDATTDAAKALESRSLRDMRYAGKAVAREIKRLQREVKDQRDAMREEVVAELSQQPVYRAISLFRTGQLDGTQFEGETKLNTEVIREILLLEDAPLPDALKGMTKAGGLHPQQAAELLGYTSADHLLKDLLFASPFDEAVDAETDQRMRERYGELNTPEEVEEAAQAAVHNEVRGRFVATELAALQNAPGKKRVLAAAAKRIAQGTIAKLRIRDLRPGQYEVAERRAAKAARDAGATNLDEAVRQKRNQLLQFNLAKAAHEARDEVKAARDYLTKLDSKKSRAHIDPAFMDQIDQLLEMVELRQVSNRESDRRTAIAKWVEEMQAQGFEPAFDVEALARKPWRELTVEEMRGLRDAVRNIEHLGRLTKKLLTAKDKADLDTAANEMAESVRVNATRDIDPIVGAKTWWEHVKSNTADFFAMHRKVANLAYIFDGNRYGGVFWDRFIRPMNAAGDNETKMLREANLRLASIFAPIMKENTTRREYVPEIGKSLSLEDRLSVALNMGNEANLQRLMDGDKWTYEQVQAIIAPLRGHHWDFVESVWREIDSWWPQIAAKERRVSGMAPEKVEAMPFQVTIDGQLRLIPGGYFPIKYDADRNSKANADEAAEVLRQMTRGLYTNAQTRRGHTKARVDTVNRPLRKGFGVIFSHVNQVVHDLAWHEYLIDANRLLRHGAVDNAIRDHHGPKVLEWMSKALEDIAIGDIPAQNGFEKSIRYVRTGVSIASMGWSIWTSLLQPIGLTQSMSRIGTKHVLKGAGDLLSNPAKMNEKVEWVYSVSPFMKDRGNTMQREINEVRNRIGAKSPLAAAVARVVPEELTGAVTGSFFYMLGKAQLMADLPTWLGQYSKSIDEGQDPDTAVAIADQAVIDSQSSGMTKDLAGAQRGSELMRLFTNFYSYFSATFNLMSDRTQQLRRIGAADLPYYMVDIMLLTVVPATITSLMYTALRTEDDEPEDWLANIAKDNAAYMMGLMIGAREVGGAVSGVAGYQGPAGARIFAELGRLGKQVGQGEVDEAAVRAANSTAGILLHYPSAQMDRTVRGLMAAAEGEAGPQAVLLGPPVK